MTYIEYPETKVVLQGGAFYIGIEWKCYARSDVQMRHCKKNQIFKCTVNKLSNYNPKRTTEMASYR